MQFLCYLNVLVSHCSMLCLFLSITLLILIFLNRSQGGGGLVCLFAYRLTDYLLNSLMYSLKQTECINIQHSTLQPKFVK